MEGIIKILVTDKVHDILIQLLQKENYKVDYYPNISMKEVLTIIKDYDGLVFNSKVLVKQPLIDAAKGNLKFVGRLGSGMDNVDLQACQNANIQVFRSPEGNANAVAEHALGSLLALSNNLLKANNELKNGIWEREGNRGFEICNKKVGIIGFGHTGKAFAKKLSGWVQDICYYDKYILDHDENYPNIVRVELVELIESSDIISFHIPLTKETHQYVNDNFYSRCKKGVYLINTSRGKILNYESLAKALDLGFVKGACLDVFQEEPPFKLKDENFAFFKSILDHENTICTPHIAGWTHESLYKIGKIIADKFIYFIDKCREDVYEL